MARLFSDESYNNSQDTNGLAITSEVDKLMLMKGDQSRAERAGKSRTFRAIFSALLTPPIMFLGAVAERSQVANTPDMVAVAVGAAALSAVTMGVSELAAEHRSRNSIRDKKLLLLATREDEKSIDMVKIPRAGVVVSEYRVDVEGLDFGQAIATKAVSWLSRHMQKEATLAESGLLEALPIIQKYKKEDDLKRWTENTEDDDAPGVIRLDWLVTDVLLSDNEPGELWHIIRPTVERVLDNDAERRDAKERYWRLVSSNSSNPRLSKQQSVLGIISSLDDTVRMLETESRKDMTTIVKIAKYRQKLVRFEEEFIESASDVSELTPAGRDFASWVEEALRRFPLPVDLSKQDALDMAIDIADVFVHYAKEIYTYSQAEAVYTELKKEFDKAQEKCELGAEKAFLSLGDVQSLILERQKQK